MPPVSKSLTTDRAVVDRLVNAPTAIKCVGAGAAYEQVVAPKSGQYVVIAVAKESIAPHEPVRFSML